MRQSRIKSKVGAWSLLLAVGLWPMLSRANFYEESCQTIRLHGKVERVAGMQQDTPLELTLAYQLNFQKHPAYLRINLPVGQQEFLLTIVGFRSREAGDIFIPSIFLYPRTVKFQYYVKSADGRWMSETRSSEYFPAAAKVEDSVECQPDFYLDSLTSKKAP